MWLGNRLLMIFCNLKVNAHVCNYQAKYTLQTGHTIVGIGYWVLGIGYWVLGVGSYMQKEVLKV